MERSARVYRSVGRETCSFFSCAETNVRRHRSHGRVYFFFLIPPTPAADGFSIRPSVDRSIDRSAPRDRLSNRDRSAVPFPLCRLFAGKKKSAQHRPTAARNRVNKCWGLRVWIRICVRVGGCSSRKCDLATTHRSRSSRTRDVFFRIRALLFSMGWAGLRIRGGRGLAIRDDFWGFWWVSTWEPVRDETFVSTSFGILDEFLRFGFFFLFMETNDVLTGSMSWKFYFSYLIEVFKVLFELIPLIFFNLKR